MHIIIGLGNPGKEYFRTRHNVGFDVIDVLSEKLNITLSRNAMNGLIGEGFIGGEKVLLVKPQTFMNLSGQRVTALTSFYKTDMENVMVIYDDIDLPLGKLRLRKDGSAGTHNGMRSILGCIGNQQGFPRIRVGVGAKPEGWDLADWVLSTYRIREEREEMEKAFTRAADCVEDWIKNGIEHAMQQYNGK